MNAAVKASGEGAFEVSLDLALRLALAGASLGVSVGLGVAAQSGQCHGVQGVVECSVAAAVEPVPGSLPAAGLQRIHAGEGGEGRLVVDPAPV